MSDLVFPVSVIGFFLACWAYLVGLDRLGTTKE
jgi:hypothetical protein